MHIKYGEGMLGYCPIPSPFTPTLYTWLYLILNVLQPHLPVQCDCSPSPSFPFTPPSFLSPFPSLPFPCTPPPSVFPMDCLPIDSYCICTSLFIIPPSPHSLLLVPSIFGGEVWDLALWLTLNTQHRAAHVRHLSGGKRSSKWQKGWSVSGVSACIPQCSI